MGVAVADKRRQRIGQITILSHSNKIPNAMEYRRDGQSYRPPTSGLRRLVTTATAS